MSERQPRTAYEWASDSYARHTRECERCAGYHGPPLEACEAGDRLLKKMAAALEAGR